MSDVKVWNKISQNIDSLNSASIDELIQTYEHAFFYSSDLFYKIFDKLLPNSIHYITFYSYYTYLKLYKHGEYLNRFVKFILTPVQEIEQINVRFELIRSIVVCELDVGNHSEIKRLLSKMKNIHKSEKVYYSDMFYKCYIYVLSLIIKNNHFKLFKNVLIKIPFSYTYNIFRYFDKNTFIIPHKLLIKYLKKLLNSFINIPYNALNLVLESNNNLIIYTMSMDLSTSKKPIGLDNIEFKNQCEFLEDRIISHIFLSRINISINSIIHFNSLEEVELDLNKLGDERFFRFLCRSIDFNDIDNWFAFTKLTNPEIPILLYRTYICRIKNDKTKQTVIDNYSVCYPIISENKSN
jgi:hypothetical protein